MTELLKQAFAEAPHLPPAEQDAFAARILHELRMDARWDKTLDESTDALVRLAADALNRHERGESEFFGRPTSLGVSVFGSRT